LALIIILTTDNIIISYLIGLEETAVYGVINKVCLPFIFFPLSTLYSKAFYDKDFVWIKETFKKLNLFLYNVLELNINWGLKRDEIILFKKDEKLKTFKEFIK
jgi:hypothetical protein